MNSSGRFCPTDDNIYAGDQRIAMYDQQGKLYFYLNDHLGSPRVVVDDSTGNISDKYDYYAFGGNLSTTTATNQPRRYTGKPFDDENSIDLYYHGARYYGPEEGRFLAIDPLASKYPGWSPYVYTLDNPLKYTDPTGMAATDEYNPGQDEQNRIESDPQTGSAIRATRVKRQVTEATAEVVTQAVEQGTEAAQNVGAAVVTTAGQLETVAQVGGAASTIVGGATANLPLLAVGGALNLVALGFDYVQTMADPSNANLAKSAVKTALTVGTAGAYSYVKVAQTAGRLTPAQAAATRVSFGMGQAAVGAGAEEVIRHDPSSMIRYLAGGGIPIQR